MAAIDVNVLFTDESAFVTHTVDVHTVGKIRNFLAGVKSCSAGTIQLFEFETEDDGLAGQEELLSKAPPTPADEPKPKPKPLSASHPLNEACWYLAHVVPVAGASERMGWTCSMLRFSYRLSDPSLIRSHRQCLHPIPTLFPSSAGAPISTAMTGGGGGTSSTAAGGGASGA
jgi:hypothetical protein